MYFQTDKLGQSI